MTDVVSPQVAEDEFRRMCEVLDIELDDLDEEDQTALDDLKKPILKAIQKGKVTIDEKGQPTIQLMYPVGEVSSVTFYRPTGQTLIAAGDSKAKNDTTKLWGTMADFTRQPSTLFGKMDYRVDFKICMSFVRLFLG